MFVRNPETESRANQRRTRCTTYLFQRRLHRQHAPHGHPTDAHRRTHRDPTRLWKLEDGLVALPPPPQLPTPSPRHQHKRKPDASKDKQPHRPLDHRRLADAKVPHGLQDGRQEGDGRDGGDGGSGRLVGQRTNQSNASLRLLDDDLDPWAPEHDRPRSLKVCSCAQVRPGRTAKGENGHDGSVVRDFLCVHSL